MMRIVGVIIITMSLLFSFTHNVAAVDFLAGSCNGVSGNSACDKANAKDEEATTVYSAIQSITRIAMFILGGVSVIMIVFAGFKYAASNGDAKAAQEAKSIILYSVIGVVVAIAAYAIVVFVVNILK